MESILIDIATIIGVVATGLRTLRKNPRTRAYEDAIALAIISDILEQTAEPLSQSELVETFRQLAREATANEQANEELSNMKAQRIWFLASQVKIRTGDRVTITDGGALGYK